MYVLKHIRQSCKQLALSGHSGRWRARILACLLMQPGANQLHARSLPKPSTAARCRVSESLKFATKRFGARACGSRPGWPPASAEVLRTPAEYAQHVGEFKQTYGNFDFEVTELIATLHRAGLATLTHTPSPMVFLNDILGRPKNEVPYLLLVVGHPAADCRVPDIERKPVEEISQFVG